MFNKFSIKNGRVIEGAESGNADIFYALDTKTRPIPPYMYIIVFTKEKVYNQYNIYKDSPGISILTWIEPVPYATPLFIYSNLKEVYASFDEKPPAEEYNQIEISPIYVLTEKVMKNTVYIDFDKPAVIKYFKPPKFLFRIYTGRIIPDPNGQEIQKLIDMRTRPISLLETLQSEYRYRTVIRIIISLVIILITLLFYTNNKHNKQNQQGQVDLTRA